MESVTDYSLPDNKKAPCQLCGRTVRAKLRWPVDTVQNHMADNVVYDYKTIIFICVRCYEQAVKRGIYHIEATGRILQFRGVAQ